MVDIIQELKSYGVEVLVHDPLADAEEAKSYYGLELKPLDSLSGVDAVIIAVMHHHYRQLGLSKIAGLCSGRKPIVLDLKGIFSTDEAREQNITYWRL